jgi:hypothetical protein
LNIIFGWLEVLEGVERVESVALRCETIVAAICGMFHCGKVFKGLEELEVVSFAVKRLLPQSVGRFTVVNCLKSWKS